MGSIAVVYIRPRQGYKPVIGRVIENESQWTICKRGRGVCRPTTDSTNVNDSILHACLRIENEIITRTRAVSWRKKNTRERVRMWIERFNSSRPILRFYFYIFKSALRHSSSWKCSLLSPHRIPVSSCVNRKGDTKLNWIRFRCRSFYPSPLHFFFLPLSSSALIHGVN